jgi:hypothetical protein
MTNNKPKPPVKGAVSKLRDLYQKRKGKASPELLDILKDESKKSPEKKSAKPRDPELET